MKGRVEGGVEKCWGKVWKSVLGCGGRERCGGKRRCGEVWGRCEKVCLGVGEVRGDVGGCGKCWGGVGKCVEEVRGDVGIGVGGVL